MTDLSAWIGRSRSAEDEITRPALRRIAAMLDRADEFSPGAPIPPHWYAMFFPDIAPQSGLGPDGHPRKGDFLPPVDLPRRMFAGRRVTFPGRLRVGDVSTRHTEITAITPKTGRSGRMVFVTLRHTITAGGAPAVIEEQDVVYREPASPGAPPPAATPAPADAAWRETVLPDTVLLFRYSAVTFNGHRIHYDTDYTRGVEGYPGLVVNGGLTLLLLEAARRANGTDPTSVSVRNLRPLHAGHSVTLAGTPRAADALAWAADAEGNLAVTAELGYA
jgi:3-methylfumaryl-CoA hydratase